VFGFCTIGKLKRRDYQLQLRIYLCYNLCSEWSR